MVMIRTPVHLHFSRAKITNILKVPFIRTATNPMKPAGSPDFKYVSKKESLPSDNFLFTMKGEKTADISG
jgi:hypothetical protein